MPDVDFFESLMMPDAAAPTTKVRVSKYRRSGVPADDEEELVSSKALLAAIASVVGSSGNQLNALVITDAPFNAVADAVVGGLANSWATGTDCTPAYNDAMAAAQPGQMIIIPKGCLFKTKPNQWKDKKMFVVCRADTFHAAGGCDFVDIVQPTSGAYKRHMFIHYGNALGMTNIASHTKANFDAGTGPLWGNMIGNFIRVYNSNQNRIYFDQIDGFAAGIQVAGESILGVQNGSQENKFYGNGISRCKDCVYLKSINGLSYCDKNKFSDFRVSGNMGIRMDGYSLAATNGEIYNGAFRSNTFENILFERLDYAMDWRGDATYNRLVSCHIEGGLQTGAFAPADQVIYWRKSFPNPVDHTSIIGMEFFNSDWFTNLGLNTVISASHIFYLDQVFIGYGAIADGAGNITINTVSNVSQSTMALLPAIVKLNYPVEKQINLSRTSIVTITGGAAGSLTGGGVSLPPNLPVGTVIELEGSGVVNTTNPPTGNITYVLTIGSYTRTIVCPLYTWSPVGFKNFRYKIRIVTRGTGTNAAGYGYFNLYFADEPDQDFTDVIASGIDTVTPVLNFTAQWSLGPSAFAANVINGYISTIKVFKP
jgi:hypothetical protein